jgi:hypothetical protein
MILRDWIAETRAEMLISVIQGGESGSFLEKKNQKTFGPWVYGRRRHHNPLPSIQKVFCFFFSKKKRFLAYA